MNKTLMFLIVVMIADKSFGQFDKELFSVNYTYTPTGSDDHDFTKTEMKFDVPIKIKNAIIRNIINLNYYEANFQNNIEFNTTNLEQVYGINYGMMYNHHITDNWALALQAGISLTSNLTNNLSDEDFLFNGKVIAVKKGGTADKPSKFMFGLGYTTITGKPKVLPMISYTKQVNEKFSYGIGFPCTYASYLINERNTLKSILWMNGFYSNLSDPINVKLEDYANKASFSEVSMGLDYSYKMDESWSIVFKGGYSLKSKYDLLDNESNIVYSFKTSAKPYFSTGVKFNLNRIK